MGKRQENKTALELALEHTSALLELNDHLPFTPDLRNSIGSLIGSAQNLLLTTEIVSVDEQLADIHAAQVEGVDVLPSETKDAGNET